MENEIQIVQQGQLQSAPGTLSQTGDYNTQVAYLEKLDASTNVFVMNSEQGNLGVDAVDAAIAFNYEYYHLFVMEGNAYTGKSFLVDKSVALTQSTADALMKKYFSFSADARNDMLRFPALFAAKNRTYKTADDSQFVSYGYVVGIDVFDKGIQVSFVPISRVPQKLFNEHCSEFGLDSVMGCNELDTIHWSIKRGNVKEILKNFGYRVLAY